MGRQGPQLEQPEQPEHQLAPEVLATLAAAVVRGLAALAPSLPVALARSAALKV
jgi:hypothetical protein